MQSYRKSVRSGEISEIKRDGHDLILKVSDIYRSKYTSGHGTVTFSDAGDITSVYEFAPEIGCDLEPGLRIANLEYDDGAAWLTTEKRDWHDSYPASHRIRCTGIRFNMHLSAWTTFLQFLRKF